MSNEEAKTESQIQDKRALALQNLKDTIVASQDESDARAFDEMADVLRKATSNTSPEQRNVIDAAEEVAPKPEAKRAYGSGGRTHPAQLADYRYRCLPKWQQEFRNPADDMIVARFFRALGTNDHAAMARLMDEDKHMRADLAEGNSTAGAPFDGTAGQLLPLPVSNFINIALYRMARFRALANTTTTTTGASLRIPRQNAISASAWGPEGDPLDAGEPTVSGELNLQLQKLNTLANLTNEVLEDEVFGIVNWLVNDVTMQIAETEDEALYSSGAGSGSNEPNGFEAFTEIITATTGDPTIVPIGGAQILNEFLTVDLDYQSVLELFFSIGEKERTNAIFAGPDSVMQVLSSVEDGSGRPIFNMQNSALQIVGDDASGGQIGTILGRPVINLPGAEGTSNSNENRLYFFNPMRSYAILEQANVRVESSRDVLFASDKTHFRFIRRVDGGVIGNTITARPQFKFIGGIIGAGTPADT